MSNYPDGSENDPSAPWNQKDPKMTEWEQYDDNKQPCDHCEKLEFLNSTMLCEECFEPKEIEDDEEERYQSYQEDNQ